jgi:hypothetical protein
MNWSIFWFLLACLFAGAWLASIRGGGSAPRVNIASSTNIVVLINGTLIALPEQEIE